MNKLPQPSPERLAEAINKFLIPAAQRQPVRKDKSVDNILKKFGAKPYIPGKKITVMVPESKLLILDQVLRGGFKDKRGDIEKS
jgi:hypothetical protein